VYKVFTWVTKMNKTFSQFFSFNGNSSTLTANFQPPIRVPEDAVIGLASFSATNSIPNVYTGKNRFLVLEPTAKGHYMFPTGSFELFDLEKTLQHFYPKENLTLTANFNTLRVEMYCDYDIDLTEPDSIASVIGFEHKIYPGKTKHISATQLEINPVTDIRIECNIAGGSYINGVPSHLLAQLVQKVDIGFTLFSEPKTIIYLPVTEPNYINNITIKVLDQKNRLVDFREEPVSVSLHIKSASL
jgi:hypothetical protein